MNDKSTPIPGYKGFDKDLKCRDMQYALNSEFTEPEVEICQKGLHFCENPLDVFGYYPPAESRYASVVGSGESDREANSDTKVAVTYLKVGDEISLHRLIESGVKYIIDRTTPSGAASNSGDRGAASNSGDRGAASNSGIMGAASNSGDRGAASNSGDRGAAFTNAAYSIAETDAPKSIAVAVGYQDKARGSIGSWLVLAERNDEFEIVAVKAVHVDGKKIKANVFYILTRGKLVTV